ncbi:MAG: DUF177 domain-containing protein [Bacteroidetes bacterium]|nr:DUF177 domain-containing protein [Bacteroidota bacterium]
MKVLDTIQIALAGLAEGDHQYHFDIDGSFFKSFEFSGISKCNLGIEIQMNKSSYMLVIEAEMEGKVNVPCDSCGSDFYLAIRGDERLIVKIGEQDNFDDEVWIMKSFDTDIDLTHFVYECAMIMLPAKRIHRENECDEEALKNLEKYSLSKVNKDPRWDKLKEIV